MPHQSDCCGSREILAINRAEEQRFAAAEATCVPQYGFCGCPPKFGSALDDGTNVPDMSQATVECVQGQCRSKFDGATFPCGDKTCTANQYCFVGQPSTGAEDYSCADRAAGCSSCGGSCDPPSCACIEGNGRMTIGCATNVNNPTTCAERAAAAAQTVGAAFAAAETELSCASDADCALVSGNSQCGDVCTSGIVTTAGEKVVQRVISLANSMFCLGFLPGGECTPVVPGPCPGPPPGAACVDGACAPFPPEKWASFTVAEGRGADSTFSSTPARCDLGHDCTLWKITPDAAIQKTTNGTPSSARLSSTDFATVDGILRSIAFRKFFSGAPPQCDPAPPDIRVSIDLENQFQITGFSVTGCALVGPAGNDVKRIYDIFQAY